MFPYNGSIAAVLGGDKRELEIVRNLLLTGITVRTYGLVNHPDFDRLAAASAAEAVRGADIIVTPAPGFGAGDQVYAPASPDEIVITEQLFKQAKPNACFVAGRSSATIREKGKSCGIRFFDLNEDDYLQVMHAIPTAEGAIALTIQETDYTIHDADALVVGYGRIAYLLARNLRAMGARVTVAARRPEVRVRAYADGHNVCGTSQEELEEAASKALLVYNTAPNMMLNEAVLRKVRKNAMVMDLASPPGGIDHEAGKALDLQVIWARGQAGKAPVHSGYAQFVSIKAILDHLEPVNTR